MNIQIDRSSFEKALKELGHDPLQYKGKKISIDSMMELYELEESCIVNAIEKKYLSAHYDYKDDLIWIDALEAAHYYYCKKSNDSLFSS